MTLPIGFFDQRFAGEVADRVRLNGSLAELLTGKLALAAVSLVTAAFFLVALPQALEQQPRRSGDQLERGIEPLGIGQPVERGLPEDRFAQAPPPTAQRRFGPLLAIWTRSTKMRKAILASRPRVHLGCDPGRFGYRRDRHIIRLGYDIRYILRTRVRGMALLSRRYPEYLGDGHQSIR